MGRKGGGDYSVRGKKLDKGSPARGYMERVFSSTTLCSARTIEEIEKSRNLRRGLGDILLDLAFNLI